MPGGKIGAVLAVCVCAVVATTARAESDGSSPDELTKSEKLGYTIGYELGRRLAERNVPVPPGRVAQGLVDAMKGRESVVPPWDQRAALMSTEPAMMPSPSNESSADADASPAPARPDVMVLRSEVPAHRPSSYVPDPISGEAPGADAGDREADAPSTPDARPGANTAMTSTEDQVEIADLDALLDDDRRSK
jgi:hypothetical protein